MAYTDYRQFATGLNIYGKARPYDATWATGVVNLTENAATGEYSSASFVDGTRYGLFQRLGGSPASSDTYLEDIIPPGAGLTSSQTAKIDLIGTGTALINAPVSEGGELLELIKDTDYLAANGRALQWEFDEITGITIAATGRFGTKLANGTDVYVNTTGVVTEPTAGNFVVSFDIPDTALSSLTPGKYDWSVEVLEGGTKITIARNRQSKTQVDIVEKYTYY